MTVSAVDRIREALESRGLRIQNKRNGGFKAQCPAHEDRTPSLDIDLGQNGAPLILCRAGCDSSTVIAALGLSWREILPNADGGPNAGRRGGAASANVSQTWARSSAALRSPSRDTDRPVVRREPHRPPKPRRDWTPGEKDEKGFRFVCSYEYDDGEGVVIRGVDRFEKPVDELAEGERSKTFKMWYVGPNGRRFNGRGDAPDVPYRLTEIRRALAEDPDRWIVIAEGEKDCNLGWDVGLVMTSNIGGAPHWKAELSEFLRDCRVAILRDQDETGLKDANKKERLLMGAVRALKRVEIPADPVTGEQAKDFSEWIEQGNTVSDFFRMIDVAPEVVVPVCDHESGGVATPRILTVSLAEIEAKEIDWLWPGWLPKGAITLLGGRAGDGKSTIAASVVSALSTGGMFPDGARAPLVNTLLVSAEEDESRTIRPRIDLHGGDAANIELLIGVSPEGGSTSWLNLYRDAELIEQVVAEKGIGLVVIDPLSSYMTGADRNEEGKVRDALQPLVAVCQKTGVAVLAIMHTGKSDLSGRKPQERLLGSTGFVALARTVWVINELPENEDEDQHGDSGNRPMVLGVAKSNLAKKPPALLFARDEQGAVRWLGEAPITIDQSYQPEPKLSRLEIAKRWLFQRLSGGMVLQSELTKEAGVQGIAAATLRRAKEDLKVQPWKAPHVPNGQWYWMLPSDTTRSAATDRQGAQSSYTRFDELLEHLPESTEEIEGAQLATEDAHEHLQNLPISREDAQDAHSVAYRASDVSPAAMSTASRPFRRASADVEEKVL